MSMDLPVGNEFSISSSVIDPIEFAKELWPDVTFYAKQEEIIYSVIHNDETFVPAGNALGKDFVAAFIALWWFCSRRPARVVTTSVKMEQLTDVLWGEIRRFIHTARYKLPILYNHMKIRALNDSGDLYPNAELVGQVSSSKEGLLGRHSTAGFKPIPNDIPRTLIIYDEASGIPDEVYTSAQTWAHRKLVIGNPFPCSNFFKRGVVPTMGGGDIPRPKGPNGEDRGYYRKVIKISAEDSPNVQLARMEIEAGQEPSNTILVAGVKSWAKYQQDLALWDEELKCVGLRAEFYEGAETMMFPSEWLDLAHDYHDELVAKGLHKRKGTAMGVDPAEGGDKTAQAIVDERGLIYLDSFRTPDTDTIPRDVIGKILSHSLNPSNVILDAGGGGKQHADRLRAMRYPVRTVGFGESVTLPYKKKGTKFVEKLDNREDRYIYYNRRAEMYGNLRELLDPTNPTRFAIPRKYTELRRQLSLIPLIRDQEGRLKMLPKDKRGKNSNETTLREILGCSPDEADALVLAVHALLHPIRSVKVGAM